MSHFFVIAFEIRQGLVVSCYQNNLFVTFIVLKKKKKKQFEHIEMIFPQKDLNYDVEYDIAVTTTLA